jgi:hypothetical protein
MAKITDSTKIIDSIIDGDRELRDLCEQASINAHVPQLIDDARTEVGLIAFFRWMEYPLQPYRSLDCGNLCHSCESRYEPRGACQSYRNVVYCPEQM